MTKVNGNKSKSTPLKFSPGMAGAFLLGFVVISLWLIFEYAAKERSRDLMSWQSRLALLAEIRAADIEDWVGDRKSQLHKLAGNSSLRLFLSEYVNKNEVNRAVLNAQKEHVRNLLRASAERFGFAENISSVGQLSKNTEYGLAILGSDRQRIMSTKGFPKNIDTHSEVIKNVFLTAQAHIIDMYAGKKQQPVYGYIIPVFQIQDLQSTSPVGAVMLLLNPQKNLYSLLQNRQSVTGSDESLLVKRTGPGLTYISPVRGEYSIFLQLPDNNNKLASSYAFHNPGSFAEMKDYRGDDVLVTGRVIKNTPWRLIQKISSSEALAESNKHQKFLLTTFILFVMIVAAVFVAIWRHSTSMRLQTLSDELETHTVLLDAVTDNINEKIILVDEDSQIIFINPVFAQALSLDEDEVKFKHLTSVLGVETVALLENSACGENHPCVLPLLINEIRCIYHVNTITLLSGEHKDSTLYVLHDISELKQEQEKREQLGRGIIATLVKAVDLHDPYCLNHSARTCEVSLEIGKEMQLSDKQLESLEMASLLANIGKLFVPKEILTKMDALSEEESNELRKHIEHAVEILSELSFNGPVVNIVAQKNERLDGSGYPAGLSGDEIMLESRILAVANAFVAMASSRAYREGRAVNDVVDMLLKQSESQYDRHVVAALFHIAENKADWKSWQNINNS